MLRISPGSEGLGAAVLGEGCEGAEFAGVSGATFEFEATDDLSQPFPAKAIIAINMSKLRFIRVYFLFAMVRRPMPFAKSTGMASAKWRSLWDTTHYRTIRHVIEFWPFQPFRRVHFLPYFRI